MSLPHILENSGDGNFMWDILSRQLKDRIVWLGSEVNEYTANLIVSQLLYLDSNKPQTDIYLYINSPGGVVSDGLAIYDTMNYISSDVSTICIGQAASMGSFLLSAGAKGKRFVLPNAEIMIHQPSGGYAGQTTDIMIHANHILRLKRRLNQYYSLHTGKDISKIERDMERDYYMTAEEAVDYGLADAILYKRDPASIYSEE